MRTEDGDDFVRPLLDWYDANRHRDLPWRDPATSPFEVLVTELVPQQPSAGQVLVGDIGTRIGQRHADPSFRLRNSPGDNPHRAPGWAPFQNCRFPKQESAGNRDRSGRKHRSTDELQIGRVGHRPCRIRNYAVGSLRSPPSSSNPPAINSVTRARSRGSLHGPCRTCTLRSVLPRWTCLVCSLVWKIVASLFRLLALATAVVVLIEDVAARVETVPDDLAGDVLATVRRHPAAPDVVR